MIVYCITIIKITMIIIPDRILKAKWYCFFRGFLKIMKLGRYKQILDGIPITIENIALYPAPKASDNAAKIMDVRKVIITGIKAPIYALYFFLLA